MPEVITDEDRDVFYTVVFCQAIGGDQTMETALYDYRIIKGFDWRFFPELSVSCYHETTAVDKGSSLPKKAA
ncbi:hypothetical protein PITCH_A960009 [uncultured Desulfobacterium sp.]|uniref:Uncharacterized protein n=1 Tax=uncultured Desulfobacterium sp. TaxID=201089 RepID=A0A445N417_9BACT|nr:hypothetical protein PITCH_A960009 [uncultured Desulfobacterium sp.]